MAQEQGQANAVQCQIGAASDIGDNLALVSDAARWF